MTEDLTSDEPKESPSEDGAPKEDNPEEDKTPTPEDEGLTPKGLKPLIGDLDSEKPASAAPKDPTSKDGILNGDAPEKDKMPTQEDEESASEELKQQIKELIKENRTLGETIDDLQMQLKALEGSTLKAIQARQEAKAQAQGAQKKARIRRRRSLH